MAYLMTFKLLVVVLLHSTSAHLSVRETLVNNTSCDLNSASIDCGLSNVIALQQVQYGYNPKCNNTCCQYNASDCLITVQDSSTIKRECSGRSSCNATLANSTHEFCTNGTQVASYIYIEYYCIQRLPLYLTNEGYPGDNIGDNSCSCSFEAKSCSSGVTSYIMDADMYDNPTSCLQNLLITDAGGVLHESVKCESYNSTFVTQKNLSSNYYQIYSDNNSTLNRTGYFFIGFQDCGIPHNITNGLIMLDIQNKSVYNATASVTCNPGFHAVNKTIVCQEQGIWSSAECIIKDCGQPWIYWGSLTLEDPNNTTFGARATVTCFYGYESDVFSISCLATGLWEAASCTIFDCGPLPTISAGELTLLDPLLTTFGSRANVTCYSGFQSEIATISCLPSAWEPASCTAIECGPVINISFGAIRPTDSTHLSYGAEASVECEDKYAATKLVIQCLASGTWDHTSCIEIVSASTIDYTAIIIVLVLFVGVPCLIQLSVAAFLHITIYTHYNSSAGKAVGYILLSAIPYIGVVFIMRFYKWKGYHGYLVDNQRKKPLHPEYESIHRNTLDDHEENGETSAKNRFSNPGYEVLYNTARSTITINANRDRNFKKEDEAQMKRQSQDDAATATNYENITMEQKADNPDYENGNFDDIAKASSAIITVTQT